MAIGRNDLVLLARLRAEGYVPDKSSVIEIGAQQLGDGLLNSSADLASIGQLFGAELPCPLPPPLIPPSEGRASVNGLDRAAPLARQFWTWLGLSYAAIDIDGSPDSISLDLNYDAVPAEHRHKYQVVTNYGTTEHIANQLNAFKVIHDLTDVGGIMIHNVPAQGMFNHGLINYNPKFFWMLARSNDYRWLHMDLSHSRSPEQLPRNIVECITAFVPDFEERMRGYGAEDCGISVVMQKVLDIDYVAPLDVTTGTRTDIKALAERYWTVFTPGALEALAKAERAEKASSGLARSDKLLEPHGD
jgi:hypothetical protein